MWMHFDGSGHLHLSGILTTTPIHLNPSCPPHPQLNSHALAFFVSRLPRLGVRDEASLVHCVAIPGVASYSTRQDFRDTRARTHTHTAVDRNTITAMCVCTWSPLRRHKNYKTAALFLSQAFQHLFVVTMLSGSQIVFVEAIAQIAHIQHYTHPSYTVPLSTFPLPISLSSIHFPFPFFCLSFFLFYSIGKEEEERKEKNKAGKAAKDEEERRKQKRRNTIYIHEGCLLGAGKSMCDLTKISS